MIFHPFREHVKIAVRVTLGLADDTEDDPGQLGRRLEQQPALQGADGDLDGTFVSVSAGTAHIYEVMSPTHTCAVRSDGSVACWGSNATAPAGTFASVSARTDYTCGVKSDGSVVCWGDNSSGQATPPTGSFAQVSAGDSFACGIRPNRRVECWGSQVRPPQD
jgi:alpha-tubulin suppressor-like RCC1 family protein